MTSTGSLCTFIVCILYLTASLYLFVLKCLHVIVQTPVFILLPVFIWGNTIISQYGKMLQVLTRKLQCIMLKNHDSLEAKQQSNTIYCPYFFCLSAQGHNQGCQVQYSHSAQAKHRSKLMLNLDVTGVTYTHVLQSLLSFNKDCCKKLVLNHQISFLLLGCRKLKSKSFQLMGKSCCNWVRCTSTKR